MVTIEKVPGYLSRPGVTIDLRRVKPDDKKLLFRDMGCGDPLETGRTIDDTLDLSPEAQKRVQEGHNGTGLNYEPPNYRSK